MSIRKKLKDLQAKVKKLQRQKDKRKAQLEVQMERLKEMGFSTVKDAKKELAKLKRIIPKQEKSWKINHRKVSKTLRKFLKQQQPKN